VFFFYTHTGCVRLLAHIYATAGGLTNMIT